MDPNTTVKLIAGVLALVLVAIIFLRRKKKKGATEDDF
jgi:LPXTG-motif cell wall-anchored protein